MSVWPTEDVAVCRLITGQLTEWLSLIGSAAFSSQQLKEIILTQHVSVGGNLIKKSKQIKNRTDILTFTQKV